MPQHRRTARRGGASTAPCSLDRSSVRALRAQVGDDRGAIPMPLPWISCCNYLSLQELWRWRCCGRTMPRLVLGNKPRGSSASRESTATHLRAAPDAGGRCCGPVPDVYSRSPGPSSLLRRGVRPPRWCMLATMSPRSPVEKSWMPTMISRTARVRKGCRCWMLPNCAHR